MSSSQSRSPEQHIRPYYDSPLQTLLVRFGVRVAQLGSTGVTAEALFGYSVAQLRSDGVTAETLASEGVQARTLLFLEKPARICETDIQEAQLKLDRRMGGRGASLGLTLSPTWARLIPDALTHLDSLGLTWMHLDSFGLTWTHLGSL